MKNYLLLATIILTACGENSEDGVDAVSSFENQDVEAQNLPYVDFILDVGNLQGNGNFRFMSSSLKTSEDIHTIYVQIGAFMVDTREHNTELLRVHFRSDYEEWVSYDEILSPVYPTQEECEEASSYCEVFDVIHGESGLVSSNEGLVGLTNTHCRYLGEQYEYHVEAWVETLETYPPTIVSDVETITVQCDVVDRGE